MPSPSDKVLKLDYRGAPQTISVMRHAALSSQGELVVRDLAEKICQHIDSKDYSSEYLAIYQYVLQSTRYMRDPRTVELVKAPYVVCRDLASGRKAQLDCDDSATLIGALILAVGGVCEFVTVAFRNLVYDGERQFSHVFCRALDPRTQQWCVLDPVAAEKTSQMLSRVKYAKFWPVA